MTVSCNTLIAILFFASINSCLEKLTMLRYALLPFDVNKAIICSAELKSCNFFFSLLQFKKYEISS